MARMPETPDPSTWFYNKPSQEVRDWHRRKLDPPESNSIWTLSLKEPDEIIRNFYNPRGFHWHPTARLRIVAA